MPIAVLVLSLVAFGYVLIRWPAARLPGLLAAAVVAAILGLTLSRQPPEGTLVTTRIPADQLTLDQIAFARTPRGASISGRVTNGSPSYRLRDMTLTLRLHDCPADDTPRDQCPVIGESRAIARPDVPPTQIRAFTAHFGFAGVPPVEGRLDWDLAITETRATAN